MGDKGIQDIINACYEQETLKSKYNPLIYALLLNMLGVYEIGDTPKNVQQKAYAFLKNVIYSNQKVSLAFWVCPEYYVKLRLLLERSYNYIKDNNDKKLPDGWFETHFFICECEGCVDYWRYGICITSIGSLLKMTCDLIVMNPPYAGKGKPLFMEITKVLYDKCLQANGKLRSINPTSIIDKTFIEDNSQEARESDYSDLMVESVDFDPKYSKYFGNADIKTGICIITYSKKSENSLFSDYVREQRFGKSQWNIRKSIIKKMTEDETGAKRTMIGESKGFFSVVDSAKDVRVQKSKANQMVIDSNNEKVVIISQLTGGKRQDGTPSWDWVTLHSEQYFSVDLPLPDIHYHAIPFKEKHEAINMVKWINTDVVGFIVYHYKFNVSNTQTMMNRIPQPPKTNGDFSDEVIKRTFGLSDEEIEWIHSEMKTFGNKVKLNMTESELMDYIDEINK